MAPSCSPVNSLHVAVIGAGAAGLVAARELRRESHSVVVFDRGTEVGGLWVYTPQSEPDPLSLDPARTVVHSSVYDSLRTNLPRECMGYSDFPFVPRPEHDESRDPRRYPNHREVLAYLRDFARVQTRGDGSVRDRSGSCRARRSEVEDPIKKLRWGVQR
ncbi:hypothetical protein Bca52824_095244 [Brassica carinata]|uniref:Flavin-containing monooxygenase n=1 Tax=Brassica carinata TaxID=52824 RepID=A0A8X7TJY5_BRACI|nr:hypothetical protein Bca52824_095244 [Brassica carinata]